MNNDIITTRKDGSVIWEYNDVTYENGDIVCVSGLELLSENIQDNRLQEQIFELQLYNQSDIIWLEDEAFQSHAMVKGPKTLTEIRHATDGEKLLFKLQREDYKKVRYQI